MKIILLSISLLAAGLLDSENVPILQYEPASLQTQHNRDTIIIFQEDFESGLPADWVSEDVTDPGSYWYNSSYNAFEGEGNSWRMADPAIGLHGGYLDGWYQVLDTPVISLPAAGSLTLHFEQYRSIEEPDNFQNFDGWDGFNVRIRPADQSYQEAEILTDCNPAYNCSSIYSFGYIHGEDPDGIPGIPGWGGFLNWQSTQITIPSIYQGQDVIISFAFASDEFTSTATNPEFSGIFIDEIEIPGIFYSNGEFEPGFVGFTNTPIGGDLWHAFTDDTPPYSKVIGCFDADSGIYNPNMKNYLTTESIFLPDYPEIYLDMALQTALDDHLFPDCDYFSIEVSYLENANWSNWNSISNPTGNPNLPNLVFTGSVDEWTMFSAGWQGYNDISSLAGHNARFRIGLHSNGNTPDSFGIKIDDFQITAIAGSEAAQLVTSPDFEAANYPNPFNPETRISFNVIQSSSQVIIDVYNVKGQRIKTLVNQELPAAQHSVVWNGTDDAGKSVAGGVYFYKIRIGNITKIQKMLLLK